MRRTKIMMTTTALALSLTLSACGGGEEEPTEPPSEPTSEAPATPSPTESEPQAATGDSEYCQQLEASQEQFDSLAQGDARQLDEAVAELRELRETAPPEIQPAWEDLLEPIERLETGLNEAGLELSDLEGVSRGEIPRGVDPQRLQELAADMQGLSSAQVNEAGEEIQQYAMDECGITLGQ